MLKCERNYRRGDFNFQGAKIYSIDLSLPNFELSGSIRGLNLIEATIQGKALFSEAKIMGDMRCETTAITRTFDFEGATFARTSALRDACRKAKQTWENAGDRDMADCYSTAKWRRKGG